MTDINQDDVKYEDSLVCILHPNVKKGVLVFTNYRTNSGMDSLKDVGLKPGKILHEEGCDLGYTKVFHPHIFFRAPWFSRKIDYATYETEIVCSFGLGHMDVERRCFIRVDPDKTYVFSSSIRESCYREHDELEKSKKTLSEYLNILAYNAELYKTVYPVCNTKTQPAYHLYTSKLIVVPNNGIYLDHNEIKYPLSSSPIELNSEILVSIPHLTPDYFVRCT